MSENRNDGNWHHLSASPDAIPKRNLLTDAQIDQVRELLAQEREALAQEREGILTAIDEAVGKLLDKQHDRIKSEIESSMRARRIEIAALKRVVAELRSLMAGDRATVIEPPPVGGTN